MGPGESWEGSDLAFQEGESWPELRFKPGRTVLHRGSAVHQALPLRAGERTNLVIWLHAAHGVVRIVPYDGADQLTATERWGARHVHPTIAFLNGTQVHIEVA